MQDPADLENQMNMDDMHWQNKAKPRTIKPHDVLQGVQVLDVGLVTAEDLGSWTEIIGKILSILLPHFSITTQAVDVLVEGNIVGWPVTCGTHRRQERSNYSNVKSNT